MTMHASELRVRDVMSTGAHHVEPDVTIEEVHRLMRLGGLRHVPVVSDGRLVGVVSERDVLASWTSGSSTPVQRVMTRSPRWVHADAPAHEAAGLLVRHKIGCLPVLDEARVVVGIVTESDFVALAQRALAPEPTRSHEAPS
jgi:CBS domain-containing protein